MLVNLQGKSKPTKLLNRKLESGDGQKSCDVGEPAGVENERKWQGE
jgi:hypothetical protein